MSACFMSMNHSISGDDRQSLRIIEISLNLSKLWHEVNQDAARKLEQSHVIEELCPMISY